MKSRWSKFFLLVGFIFVGGKVGANLKWLGLDGVPENDIWEPDNVCRKQYGFTGKQTRFCRKHFKWMKIVQDTARETKEECQEEFKNQKWNCMSVSKAPRFDNDITKDTKEAGFLYALSSASLALSVSHGCLMGNIAECRCNLRNKPLLFPSEVIDRDQGNMSYIDSRLGCKGIMKYGHDFSEMFVKLGFRKNAKSQEQLEQHIVRKHNIRVGLNAIVNGEEIACVCNGATAGCVVKYCYRRLVQIQEVSEKLFRKYNKAVQARFGVNILKIDPSRNNDKVEESYVEGNYAPLKKIRNQIIFASSGPDKCMNGKTSRRRCQLDPSKPNAPDNCNRLCCGRSYQEKIIETVTQCDCKFVFCCKVECKTCRSTKKIYECN